MRKFAYVLLSFMLFANVTMAKATDNGAVDIQSAFEKLEVNLSVMWDQKDAEAKKEYMKEFHKDINSLYKKGMKTDDLMAYVESNLLDASAASDLKLLTSSIDPKELNSPESKALVSEFIKKNYSVGSSWTGSAGAVVATVVVVAVLVALIVAIAVESRSSGGTVIYDDGYYDDGYYDDGYYYDDCYYDDFYNEYICY